MSGNGIVLHTDNLYRSPKATERKKERKKEREAKESRWCWYNTMKFGATHVGNAQDTDSWLLTVFIRSPNRLSATIPAPIPENIYNTTAFLFFGRDNWTFRKDLRCSVYNSLEQSALSGSTHKRDPQRASNGQSTRAPRMSVVFFLPGKHCSLLCLRSSLLARLSRSCKAFLVKQICCLLFSFFSSSSSLSS